MRIVYFVGTAGSGKSTLVGAFSEWCEFQGFRVSKMNLDPGAEGMPYAPDIDIRDWVHLDNVMAEYDLGPNGAQVVAADLMAMNIRDIAAAVQGFEQDDLLLIDTPGQMELFAFRQSSSVIVDALGKNDSMLMFLADPMLSATAPGFVSNLMLYAMCQFRFSLPVCSLLSKADLLGQDDIDRMMQWSSDPYSLYGALTDEQVTPQSILSIEMFKAMENMGMYPGLMPVSSQSALGMEDVYNAVQQVFEGGEDLQSQ